MGENKASESVLQKWINDSQVLDNIKKDLEKRKDVCKARVANLINEIEMTENSKYEFFGPSKMTKAEYLKEVRESIVNESAELDRLISRLKDLVK